MPKASRVRDEELDLDYDWMFDIQSQDELEDWLSSVRSKAAIREFANAVQSHEGGGKGGHAKEGYVLVLLAGAKNVGLLETLGKLNFDLAKGMTRALAATGRIFINNVGGYFTIRPALLVWGTIELDGWVLPMDSLKFSQWPGGSHWYAHYGVEDVVWKGQEKWSSKELAENAGQEWLAARNGAK